MSQNSGSVTFCSKPAEISPFGKDHIPFVGDKGCERNTHRDKRPTGYSALESEKSYRGSVDRKETRFLEPFKISTKIEGKWYFQKTRFMFVIHFMFCTFFCSMHIFYLEFWIWYFDSIYDRKAGKGAFGSPLGIILWKRNLLRPFCV